MPPNGAENPSNNTHRPAKRPICWPSPVEEIESVADAKQLKGLVRLAASCADLDTFRNATGRS